MILRIKWSFNTTKVKVLEIREISYKYHKTNPTPNKNKKKKKIILIHKSASLHV